MNFKYLDDLIHCGAKEITLDCDIILDDDEMQEYQGGILVDVDNLIIDGNGHTIDACGKSMVFICDSKNITIKSITIKNGYSDHGYGGAILNNSSSSLTIIDSTFKNNCSKESSGAIENYMGELTVIRSTFEENLADGSGGAIVNDVGKITVVDSMFIANAAESGGAIDNFNGKLSITNSIFRKNFAKEDGGAIYNWSSEIIINESVFEKNAAKDVGGAIGIFKSPPYEFSHCTFTDNEPDDVYHDK
jgi:hypothetical protein